MGSWAFTVAGWLATATLLTMYIGAKSDIKAEIEQCNTEKAVAVAEAQEITRIAQKRAADERVRQVQAELEREAAAVENERQRRIQAENRAAERDQALQDLAEEAFDEDEIPDSDACLNAFVTSRALRCVLHTRDHREAGAGGSGDSSVCADPQGADGVHTGFSNVTFLDALQYWGGDRDAAIRLNGRLAEIREISEEVVNDGSTGSN